MTTHVLIVNEATFKIHLEYQFIGTGNKDKSIDFNGSATSRLHFSTEQTLVPMMADGCRMRKDDFIIFYLQASNGKEGKFYGIFRLKEDCIFLEQGNSNQYLIDNLGKSLTFRQLICPYEVYAKGVTEWETLDVIRNIQSPCQMIWSLIYRKLKGNRGNTMITIYEAERLFNLIRAKNNYKPLDNKYFSFSNDEIVTTDSNKDYKGDTSDSINILPRLIYKYNCKQAFEAHLQMYILQSVGRNLNPSLEKSLDIDISKDKIEWIGNEVSCGVGMQRIDLLLSVNKDDKHILYTIELKAVKAETYNLRQIKRYIDWLEQYYIPNRPSIIQPVLICRKSKDSNKNLSQSFTEFNNEYASRCLPLKYIEFEINKNNLSFTETNYQI